MNQRATTIVAAILAIVALSEPASSQCSPWRCNLVDKNIFYLDGWVGIGTDDPRAGLHLTGHNLWISRPDQSDPMIELTPGFGTLPPAIRLTDAAGFWSLAANPFPEFAISHSGVGKLVSMQLGHTDFNTGVSINLNSSAESPHLTLEEDQDSGFARLTFAHAGAPRFWTLAGHANDAGFPDVLNVYHSEVGNVISIGREHTDFNSGVSINRNSTTGSPHLTLEEDNVSGFARLTFANAGSPRFWTLAGHSPVAPPFGLSEDDRFNIYHSEVGNVISINRQRADFNVGIKVNRDSTVSSPHLTLEEDDDDGFARLTFAHTSGGRFWTVAARAGEGGPSDRLNIYHSDAGNILQVRASDETVSVPVLEVRGADLAEKFPVSETVGPGMVVAIDPDHPGAVRLSRHQYDHRVAGVVSGAGDLAAGAILGNLPGYEEAPAIALSGRVWVLCDATPGPVRPGDLLTTSDVPGHAMAVIDHVRAQGAVLGKAMTSLESGRGLVLVLVSLQ